MNRARTIIIITLSSILVGSLVYFVYLSRQEADETTQQTTNSNNDTSESRSAQDTKSYNVLANSNESFVVDLETKDEANNVSYTGTVSHDGRGNYLLEGRFNDDDLRFYVIDKEYISCQNDTCFALPSGENGVDSSTYNYSQEQLSSYTELAEYQGESDCRTGICDTWSIVEENSTLTFYVSAEGKIVKSEGTINSTSFTAEFSYEPVQITSPTNVLENPFQ